MRQKLLTLICVGFALCACKNEIPRAIPQDPEMEAKIEKILSRIDRKSVV